MLYLYFSLIYVANTLIMLITVLILHYATARMLYMPTTGLAVVVARVPVSGLIRRVPLPILHMVL